MLATVPEDLLDVAQLLDSGDQGVHVADDAVLVERATCGRGADFCQPDLLVLPGGVQLLDLTYDPVRVRVVQVRADDVDLVEAITASGFELREPWAIGERESRGEVCCLRMRGAEEWRECFCCRHRIRQGRDPLEGKVGLVEKSEVRRWVGLQERYSIIDFGRIHDKADLMRRQFRGGLGRCVEREANCTEVSEQPLPYVKTSRTPIVNPVRRQRIPCRSRPASFG